MLRRSPEERYLHRVYMIAVDHRQQLEYLEDRDRWHGRPGQRLAKLRVPPSFAAEHAQLQSLADIEVPYGELTEADVRDHVRRGRAAEAIVQRLSAEADSEEEQLYARAVEILLCETRDGNERLGVQVPEETEKALRKLRRLRVPDWLAEGHAALIAAYERFRDEVAAFYPAYIREDEDGAAAAWRRADAARAAVVEASERLHGPGD